jgi:hypothetical protein
MLQGVERRFERVVLYRSRLHMLRHAAVVLNTARIAWARRLRLWLQDAQQRDNRKSHLAEALAAARRLKQALTNRR